MSTTYLGETTARGKVRRFGLKSADRALHMYAVGMTGVGKTTLLQGVFANDVERGEGGIFIDAHGDAAEELRDALPSVRYLDANDPVWSLNPLTDADPATVAGLVSVFRHLFDEDWGPRLEHLLRNALFLAGASPKGTLATCSRLLVDRGLQRECLVHVTNPEVRSFWENEFEGYSGRFRAVVVAPLQNKLGALLTDPRLAAILSGAGESVDLPQAMEEGTSLIVNLRKGEIGEVGASLLGSLLIAEVVRHGLARSGDRRPFHVIVDECQSFVTTSVVTALSELRKYGVSFFLANQYLDQLRPEIRTAVLGNAGTLIVFRVGVRDAVRLAPELQSKLDADDLVRLPNHHFCVRLMIDGQPSQGFSGRTVRVPRAA